MAGAEHQLCNQRQGDPVRDIKATNRGLILSAAWRIAEDPNNHLSKILKSKYYPDTSFWKANHNVPKSAFWTGILKVRPMLIRNSSYQLTEGNISLWSNPWYNSWDNIYDHLIIQPREYEYPALVKDLWLPNQNKWNNNLIDSLFHPDTATVMKQVPIIQDNGKDLLCWKLTPSGKFTAKSAYKLCLQVLQEEGEPQPTIITANSRELLKQIWKAKDIAPRIQTFAWRLIRKALPTGIRAGKYTSHISKFCSRCGVEEDEKHILFLCPFAKAAWFVHPWYIRIEDLLRDSNSITSMILGILNSNHPHATLSNVFTFMWCMWKSRNDKLFQRKENSPLQFFYAAQAIANCISQEVGVHEQSHKEEENQELQIANTYAQGTTVDLLKLTTTNRIFTDAAWKNQVQYASNTRTGLGVYMHINQGRRRMKVQIYATGNQAESAIQAEAQALVLAANILARLQIRGDLSHRQFIASESSCRKIA